MIRRTDPDLRTHLYVADPTMAPDHRDRRPCTCGMPQQWRGHDLPDTAEANAASRERAGDRGDR